jgi:nitric oxide reductase NorQ protein
MSTPDSTPNQPPGATPAAARPAVATPGFRWMATSRLGAGELRRQVAAHLAAHPGRTFTPGEIARELHRSAGAVGNALDTLAARGQAEKTSTAPRRYRNTATTMDATTDPPRSTTGSRPSRPPVSPAAAALPRASGSPSPPSGPGGGARGAPGGGAAASPAAGGPVRRPNGQAYHPRLLADLPDVAALRRLRAAGISALLYGPPGTGKTSLVEAAFPDLITVAGDGDTAVADFVGEYTQTPEGAYEFVYGPLVAAMTEGRCLFIDDATLISPKVLAVVYPAMDGRRQIQVKAHKGETITAAEGFYVIAGHNPGVHGAVLTEALASRFAAQIQVSTDYDLARTLKINPHAIRVARNLARRQAAGEIGWAPQLRELIAFQKIAAALGPDAAVANLLGIAPEEDRDVVTEVISSVYGRTITPLALGRQI